MNRNVSERIRDVRRLQQAARVLAENRAALVPALVQSTGLSTEGVELALCRHVELTASEEELTRLVHLSGDTKRVAVVLSANVFVGAFRALVLARAASDEVVVRPSRRCPTFARALVESVRAAGDLHVRIDEELDLATLRGGEIHVYGRDETIADVRARVGGNARVRGHGSGMGIAWVSRKASLQDAARDLAADVVVFDQRGCLSPRIALIEGLQERASDFADALHAELEQRGRLVPRGELPREERSASLRYATTMTMACQALVGTQHVVGLAESGAPLVLPPPYRHMHVAACEALADARQLVSPLEAGILMVGSDDLEGVRRLTPRWARVASLGWMQRPPLDGPVDLRDS